jgi:hypothetical protein
MNIMLMSWYKIDKSHIHKNCIHYKDGFCTLNQFSVDPDGTACPRFTPNHVMKPDKNEGTSLGSMQPNQLYPHQRGQGYSPGRRSTRPGLSGKRRMQRGGRGRVRKRIAAGPYNLNIPLPEPHSPDITQEKQNLTNQLEDLKIKIKDIKQRLEKGA